MKDPSAPIVEESNGMTLDEKLDDIEKLLIDSIHRKVSEGEALSTVELQLVTRWLKSRDSVGKPKKPVEPIVTHGAPLPFLTERLPFTEASEALQEVM